MSHFIEVDDGVRMHYLDEGEGDPILVIHGIPTSAYLWRDVIPHLVKQGRVIAIDLMNFGKSDKVAKYQIEDEVPYIEALVNGLNLTNIRLILHDWGGPVGLAYAADHPDKVAAIAFFETAFAPFLSESVVPPDAPLGLIRAPETGRDLAINTDYWIGTIMANNQFNDLPEPTFEQKLILKMLSLPEYTEYAAPFQTPEDKEILHQFAFTIGFMDQPGPVLDTWLAFAQYVAQADIPKMAIFGNPGLFPADIGLVDPNTGEPVIDPTTGNTLTLRNVVEGNVSPQAGGWVVPGITMTLQTQTKHYLQEDAPDELGQVLAQWLESNFP